MKKLKFAAVAMIAAVVVAACDKGPIDPVIAAMNSACSEGNLEACQAVMNNRIGARTH